MATSNKLLGREQAVHMLRRITLHSEHQNTIRLFSYTQPLERHFLLHDLHLYIQCMAFLHRLISRACDNKILPHQQESRSCCLVLHARLYYYVFLMLTYLMAQHVTDEATLSHKIQLQKYPTRGLEIKGWLQKQTTRDKPKGKEKVLTRFTKCIEFSIVTILGTITMENKKGDLGPISLQFKRHVPFGDNVGKKDRKGNPINLTLYEGRILTPNRPEFFKLSREAEVRPDDIFVCGYAKTGCHWIWETLSMIRKGKGEYSKMGKGETFLEFTSPEIYNSVPSPRILNTHNEFDWLPDKVRTNKNKIILTTRNPKDVAVSLYHHHINMVEMYNYHGEFPDWFELFLEGYVDNGDFFDYHIRWEKAIKENIDHPIMILRYEEAKRDFPGAIRRLSSFINTPLTEDQVQDIADSVNFKAMKKRFEGLPTSKLVRKGEVGDWKNWLTEEQSAELDRRTEKLKGSLFEPIFEL